MLKLQFFGGFAILLNGQPLAGFTSSRAQELLAYLVLHRNTAQPRSHVAFLFWPDSTEKQALTNLRKLLHKMRKALPSLERYMAINARSLQWQTADAASSDLQSFEEQLAQAQTVAHYTAALTHYGGDLMPGHYADWLLAERERLQQRYLDALEKLIALLEEQGDLPGVIEYGQRFFQSDPLREGIYQRVMRAHALLGDPASAVRVYQACADALREHLGVQVSAGTMQAYEKITDWSGRGTANTDRRNRVVNNLPHTLTSFIGREEEIKWVVTALQEHRLLTLTGPGGSGKTRLALQAARSLQDHMQDGVVLVELAHLSDPEHVAVAVAEPLQVREQSDRPLREVVVHQLAGKHLLLLFDNCEHLREVSASMIAELLKACPQLHVLATSREPLNIPGEMLRLVPPLSIPESVDADPQHVQATEAVRLFAERAKALQADFELAPADLSQVAEICRRLDGIPLAIELAAARVRTFALAEIAARLNDSFQLLVSESQVVPPRQQTLRATMDWSFVLLSEKERRLFQRLAVFSGGFDLKSAARVAADRSVPQDLPPHEIAELVASLVDRSLVNVETRADRGRYQMLETIQQYALEKLEEAGELEQQLERHLAYFLTLAESLQPLLVSPDQANAHKTLQAERDNLRAALRYGAQKADGGQALRLTLALERYWVDTGQWQESRDWLERTLAMPATERDAPLRARAQCALSQIHYTQGEFATAGGLLERSRAYFLDHEDPQGLGLVELYIGKLDWRKGIYASAERHLQDSLAYYEKIDHAGGRGEALHFLGHVALDQGDLARAQPYFEESLAIVRTMGDPLETISLTGDLGLVTYMKEDFARAREYFMQNLDQFRAAGSLEGVARSLNRLGDLARCADRFEEAAEHYQSSLAYAREIDHVGHTLSAKFNLAFVALHNDDRHQGVALFVECLRGYQELGDQKGVANSLAGLAAAASQPDTFEKAAMLFAGSAALLEELGATPWPANRLAIDHYLTSLRTRFSDRAFQQAWAAGSSMDLDELVLLAMSPDGFAE